MKLDLTYIQTCDALFILERKQHNLKLQFAILINERKQHVLSSDENAINLGHLRSIQKQISHNRKGSHGLRELNKMINYYKRFGHFH
ncbi:MAG TPA: hypothetical protein PLI45_00955 [Candidatus Woesebacteria bacterium]|nr:hypothetical protein [Candidatus Woesebacteria bacterium]